jgi:4-diphosphocytidyl-2-C-methyl-D-erythritol kinase
LDLADEITFAPSNNLSLVENKIADNIVLKAAEKLNTGSGVEIKLKKNIPMGAGLGGGSADAALSLYYLNKLWNLKTGEAELYQTAISLGADVPVCLYSNIHNANTAFFSGIGEVIEASPKLPEFYIVLVNPNIHLATVEVFKKLEFKPSPLVKFEWNNDEDFFEKLKNRENHLQNAAISIAPKIAEVLATISTMKGCVISRMTGSGSTCFGIFKEFDLAKVACRMLQANQDWWIKLAKPYELRN